MIDKAKSQLSIHDVVLCRGHQQLEKTSTTPLIKAPLEIPRKGEEFEMGTVTFGIHELFSTGQGQYACVDASHTDLIQYLKELSFQVQVVHFEPQSETYIQYEE